MVWKTHKVDGVIDALRPALVWLVPLSLLVAFVVKFSSPTPLTDEWLFVDDARQLAQGTIQWHQVRTELSGHPIHAPAALYLLLGPLAHFDSRVFMMVQIALLGAMFFVSDRVNAPPRPLWPRALLAIVLFTPSQYNNILWGFQITLMLSVVSGALGFWAIERASRSDLAPVKRWAASGCALAALLLASFSSGIGVLALGIAALEISLLPFSMRARIASLIAVCGIAALWGVTVSPRAILPVSASPRFALDLAVLAPSGIGTFLTANDYTIERGNVAAYWGTALAGIPWLILTASCARFAWKHRRDTRSVFALANIMFSAAMIATVVMQRERFHGWYVAFLLPLMAGTVSVLGLRAARRLPVDITVLAAVCALLALVGYARAWLNYGPEFASYVGRIEDYMRVFPDAHGPRPYPEPAGQPLTSEIIRFLAANQHPLFGDAARAVRAAKCATVAAGRRLSTLVGAPHRMRSLEISVPNSLRPKSSIAFAEFGRDRFLLFQRPCIGEPRSQASCERLEAYLPADAEPARAVCRFGFVMPGSKACRMYPCIVSTP